MVVEIKNSFFPLLYKIRQFVINLDIVPGIFSPTKVLHFFNAPNDFSEEKVYEVKIITESFGIVPLHIVCQLLF